VSTRSSLPPPTLRGPNPSSPACLPAVDIATPEVLIGGLLGVMMVFYFVGLSVSAVGRTAQHVVEEVSTPPAADATGISIGMAARGCC